MTKRIDFSRFMDPGQPVAKVAHQEAKRCLLSTGVEELVQMVLDGHGRIAVTDDSGHFRGMVRSIDVLDFLGGGQKYSKFLSGRMNTKAEHVMETELEAVTPKHTVSQALSGMVKGNADHLPLIAGKKFAGLVSEMGFVRHVRGRTGIAVEDAMVRRPMTAREHFSVADAARIMVRAGYRRLPVASKGVLLGIATPYDIISFLKSRNLLHDLKAQTLPVTEAMNSNVITVGPKDDLAVAIGKMKSGWTGLPVAEEHELMGIITPRDVLECML